MIHLQDKYGWGNYFEKPGENNQDCYSGNYPDAEGDFLDNCLNNIGDIIETAKKLCAFHGN